MLTVNHGNLTINVVVFNNGFYKFKIYKDETAQDFLTVSNGNPYYLLSILDIEVDKYILNNTEFETMPSFDEFNDGEVFHHSIGKKIFYHDPYDNDAIYRGHILNDKDLQVANKLCNAYL